MRVSIVVPSYNQAEFLETTLMSIIDQRQDEVDVELIVMDGGSTDGSVEILKRYSSQIDNWASEPDGGQAHAINKGFARSTGDVMGWVNSDDVLLPGALRSVTESFHSVDDPKLIYGDAMWIDREGSVLKTQREVDFDLPMLLWAYDYIPQPATFWTRSAWDTVGGIDTSYQCAFDYALWLSMAGAGVTVEHLPVPLAGFRFYEEQKNQRLREISDAEDRRIISGFVGRDVGNTEYTLKHAYHRARRAWIRMVNGGLSERKADQGLSVAQAAARTRARRSRSKAA